MEEKRFLAQTLSHPLHIERVVSAFYSDLTRDFVSCGETHDFWEFVYVDRGHLHVETSRRTYPLAQGQITFHPPMEYHRHIASPEYATSLCIVSFHCSSSVLAPLAHRTLTLDDVRRRALSQALKYATDLFSSVVDAHDLLYLVKKADVNGIQEQLFTNALESFLLLCALEAGGVLYWVQLFGGRPAFEPAARQRHGPQPHGTTRPARGGLSGRSFDGPPLHPRAVHRAWLLQNNPLHHLPRLHGQFCGTLF